MDGRKYVTIWIGRAALVAALALLAAGHARADVMVYATGFESPEYGIGDLDGQQAWTADTDPAPNDCVVQGGIGIGGSQAVRIVADGNLPGIWWLGAQRDFVDPTPGNPVVSVSQMVRITSLNEAHYSLGMGGLNVGELAASVFFLSSGAIWVNGIDTYFTWTAGAWKEVEVVLDYGAPNPTVTVYYDGLLVADEWYFYQPAPGFCRLEVRTNDKVVTAASSLCYDNLSITATPEPASALVLVAGLGGLALARRKARR